MDEYAKANGGSVVGVPKHVRGITATRNHILRTIDDPWVMFVDDDVKTAGWREMQYDKAKSRQMQESDWLGEWRKLFEITQDLSYRIWGVATTSAARAVYPWKPFLWHSYVTASCMGILNDGKTYFDESFAVKEDYELCLRCIKEDGGIVAARYLFWENEHWSTAGGCRDYRTQQMELDTIKRLMAMYPGMIRRVKRGGAEFSIDLDF